MRPQIRPAHFLVLLTLAIAVMPTRLPAQYPQPGPDRVVAIKAGRLVDPEKGTTETNQTILVRGKKRGIPRSARNDGIIFLRSL